MVQGQIPPTPPTPVNPNDGDVTDDSLLRPITAPPDRDRARAQVADAEVRDDVTPLTANEAASTGAGLPIVPIAIVAVIVIALLIWWLM